MIVKRLVLGALQTNCYILGDEATRECAVIDPADDWQKIIEAVQDEKLSVRYIILTHAHIDHTLALDGLKSACNAKVVAHKIEADRIGDPHFSLAELFRATPPKTRADITVGDGDTLPLGEDVLSFIHTPGHTEGGMCVLCGDILFSGDTLFNQSVGRSDFPGGSHVVLITSVLNKLMRLGDGVTVYPGHGEITSVGFERNNNPYL